MFNDENWDSVPRLRDEMTIQGTCENLSEQMRDLFYSNYDKLVEFCRAVETGPGAVDNFFAKKIKKECHSGDYEEDHSNAEEILVDILILAGFDQTVKAWEDVGPKHYS